MRMRRNDNVGFGTACGSVDALQQSLLLLLCKNSCHSAEPVPRPPPLPKWSRLLNVSHQTEGHMYVRQAHRYLTLRLIFNQCQKAPRLLFFSVFSLYVRKACFAGSFSGQ